MKRRSRGGTRLLRRARWLLLGALLLLAACADRREGPGADASPEDALPPADTASVEGTPPPVTSIQFSSEKSFTIASTSTQHLAFPSVTVLSDKRILLVYREGASHVDSSGRIMKQLGSADGSTWSAAEVLHDEAGIDDRDPSVRTLAGGDVVLSYFQYSSKSVGGSTLTLHHIFFGRSTDQGKTLGSLVQVDPGSMSMTSSEASIDAQGHWVDSKGEPIQVRACSSPIVEIGAKLYLPAYGGNTLNLKDLGDATPSRISLFVSGDKGKTWTEEGIAPQEATDIWLQEPSLLSVDGKALVVHLRTAQGSSPSNAGYLSRIASKDGGKTWGDYSDFSFIGHAPDLYRLRSGVILSAYRGLNDTYSAASVSFVYSLDQGATWSKPIVVEDCGAVECGYPSLLELDGGKLLVVYYAEGGAALKGAIYRTAVKH
jgi:hypothetical protein